MDKVVVKSNELIEKSYELTSREQKIILYLISQIKKEDQEFKTYIFSIKKFSEMMGMENYNYQSLIEITKKLKSKVLEFRVDDGKKKGTVQVSWLSYVFHNQGEGTVEMRFDPFLKPHLLQLQKHFTTFHLKYVSGLRGSHSIRLYEILKLNQYRNEVTIDVSELREMLGLRDKYPSFGNLNQRVLKPSLKEINDNTDISFDYKPIKQGRSVSRISFTIVKSPPKNHPKLLVEDEEVIVQDEFPNLYKLINQITSEFNYEVQMNTVQKWETMARGNYGESNYQEKLLSLVQDVVKEPTIHNPGGMITTILKHNVEFKPKSKPIRTEVLPKWWGDQQGSEQQEVTEEEEREFLKLLKKYQ